MKLVLTTIALLLGTLGTTLAWAAENVPDYRHCDPFCVTFEQIGDRHVATARDASGRLLALVDADSRTGALMVAANVPPLSASDSGRKTFSVTTDAVLLKEGTRTANAQRCATYSVETETETWRTETEIVTRVTMLIYCDGKLVDVRVVTIRVDIPSYPGPN